MQVFVPFSKPMACAMVLDSRRLNKQVIECRQILAAIWGESNAWKNHPCVKMYREHEQWLEYYMNCLDCAREARALHHEDVDEGLELLELAEEWSHKAEAITPDFLTEEFCEQHRRRLYTKNNEVYNQFKKYGPSYENWYFVDGELLRYANGKRITE